MAAVLNEKQILNLTLNGVAIEARSKDNFINATQLCRAGNKNFNDWYRLKSTQNLIDHFKILGTGILDLKIIEVINGGKHGGSWIHPDLAVQLAQWVSPPFAIQVSRWIRELVTSGSVSLDDVQKKLKETEEMLEKERAEHKKMEKKVLLMEDFYATQQRRIEKKEIIYIGTSNVYQSQNRFKVGGCNSKNSLKSRFSTYNTGRPTDDTFYCIHFYEVHSYTLIEKTIKTVLSRYQDSGEMYHINGNSLIKAVEFIIQNAIETVEWFNSHFEEFGRATLDPDSSTYFPPISFKNTLAITAGSKRVDIVDITNWSEEKIDAEIELILTLYKEGKKSATDDLVWSDISKIIKERHKGAKMMEWRGAFKSGFLKLKSLRQEF